MRPLPEDRTSPKRIELDMLLGKKPMPNLSGSLIDDVVWLDDGEHFLQRKEGQLRKVHALSGRSEPQPTADAKKIAAALIGSAHNRQGRRRGGSARAPAAEPADGKKKGGFFHHGDDLYYFFADGSKAVRLTRSPGLKELVSLSPDGQHVAYVRGNNLLCRGHCHADRARPHHRWLRSDFQRQDGLGLLGGDRQPQRASVLVESGFISPRVSSATTIRRSTSSP